MTTPIVTRYEGNPILTKEDIPYKVETVHNAGVAKHDGRYYMLFRSHLDTGRSIIGIAESDIAVGGRLDGRRLHRLGQEGVLRSFGWPCNLPP